MGVPSYIKLTTGDDSMVTNMVRKTLKECTECASRNIFRDVEKGETVCRDCGLVIEDRMVDFSQ